jgi:hypothetical protein
LELPDDDLFSGPHDFKLITTLSRRSHARSGILFCDVA